MRVRAVTLDLDDTLWPFGPIAARINAALAAWMAAHAPRTAAAFDADAALGVLLALRRERPELAHRPADLRREALRQMLSAAGEDPALAEDGLGVVIEARQQVDLYPEVAAALDRLSARVPVLALTNGNADLERTGVARWFTGIVSANDAGVGKPDPRIFHLACERLRLAPGEVLHAGDSLELDVLGALGAGMRAAWVHRDLTGDVPVGALRLRDISALADALERSDGQAPAG